MTVDNRTGYSPPLGELALFCLDHGIASIKESGSLIPFVIEEAMGRRHMARFAQETFEGSVQAALRHAHLRLSAVDRVAIAFEGNITRREGKTPAILVRAQERGALRSHVLAQPYDATGHAITPLGNALYLGDEAGI